MKQIEIGAIWSMEVENLERFKPELNKPFSILIDIELGIKGKQGKDDFRFTLANPSGLKEMMEREIQNDVSKNSALNNYNVLCIEQYSYEGLIDLLNKLFEEIDTSGSWKYIAKQLNQIMYWEYEREELQKYK